MSRLPRRFRESLCLPEFLCLLCSLVPAGQGTRLWADAIDRWLLDDARPRQHDQGKRLLRILLQKKAEVVGILPFRISIEGQKPTMQAGAINSNMVSRLVNALELAQGLREEMEFAPFDEKVRTTHEPNAILKLDYFNKPEDRRKLLQLADRRGGKPFRPDVLLTGEVVLTKDLGKARVLIHGFERQTPEKLDELIRFTVDTDRTILADCGVNYFVPPDLLRTPVQADLRAAARGKRVILPDFPVDVVVHYNGEKQPLEEEDGQVKLRAPSPAAGDTVTFEMHNNTRDRLGVILAVDGVSTLFKERLGDKAPAECTKWILEPGKTVVVSGFYIKERGPKNLQPFWVLPEEAWADVPESPFKGVYSLHVFGKKPERVEMPESKSISRKTSLRKLSTRRGPVKPNDEAVDGKQLQRVEFLHDEEPLAALNIRYSSAK
jgi:hypothetical protein